MANVASSSEAPASGAIVDPAKYRGKVLGAAVAGYAFDGVDLMVIALTLPLLLKEWKITMVQGGTVVSAMLIGGVVGGYVFGPIADRFGRKKAFMWCVAFFGITTGLGGFAQDYIQLAVLRFLAGLGLGAEWALGATMVAEFWPPEKRGKANSWMQMGWPLGYAFTVAAQYVLIAQLGYSWRSLYFIGALAVLVSIYVWIFVPESPIWLKMREAKKTGKATGAPPPSGFKDLGSSMKAYIIATIIMISALMCYWAVNSWLPTLLVKERGLSPKVFSTFLIGLQCVSIPAYFIAGWLADKFGKRSVTWISAFLSAVTYYLWLGFEWNNTLFFTWGLLNWFTASGMWAGLAAYVAEQFPTSIRAFGLASSFATGRLVTILLPPTLGAIGATHGLTFAMSLIAIFYLTAAIGAFLLKDTRQHV